MKTKIYALRDEKRFIRSVGKTGRALSARLREHLKEAIGGGTNHRCCWIRSMLRKGLTPLITLITEVDGNGSGAETAYISFFRQRGIALVNGTPGGEGWIVGMHHSEESKRKMSLNNQRIRKGCRMSQANKDAIRKANTGKHRPLEVRLKISLAQKGRKKSPESCLKMSLAARGRRHSEKYKQDMSLRLKQIGHRPSPLAHQRAAETNSSRAGWHHTSQARVKIAIANCSRQRDLHGRFLEKVA